MKKLTWILALVLLLPVAAAAEMQMSAGDKALMASMGPMDKGMSSAPMTGNTDKDFVAMMIPHHQGAIDMAKAELKYGTDPQIRSMAKGIVAAQTKEIAEMKAWQAKHK